MTIPPNIDIANAYLKDAKNWLDIHEVSKRLLGYSENINESGGISTRTEGCRTFGYKAFAMLLYAYECVLKSKLALGSNLSNKDDVKKSCRKYSHRILELEKKILQIDDRYFWGNYFSRFKPNPLIKQMTEAQVAEKKPLAYVTCDKKENRIEEGFNLFIASIKYNSDAVTILLEDHDQFISNLRSIWNVRNRDRGRNIRELLNKQRLLKTKVIQDYLYSYKDRERFYNYINKLVEQTDKELDEKLCVSVVKNKK